MSAFPFKPVQASYSAGITTGVKSIALEGGLPRTRLDISGSTRPVTATWVLRGMEYDFFQGAIRAWALSGGAPLELPLILDSSAPEVYRFQFDPESIRLVSIAGPVFTVSATLWVRPLAKYLDAAADPIAQVLAWLAATYGDMTFGYEAMVRLDGLVRRLPSE